MPPLLHRLLILLALLTAVGACSRHGAPPKPTLPAALRGVLGPGGTVNAGGETPLWSAQVRPGRIHVDVMTTGPELSGAITGFSADGKTARWTGHTPAGAPFALSVALRPCSDGETGMTYPLTATAEAQGRSFVGCATRPGQGLGPRD